MAFWDVTIQNPNSIEDWRRSLRRACEWTTQCSMMRGVEIELQGSEFGHLSRYRDWRGAFKGEYNAAQKRWDIYAPIWHGGQGVKALAYASRALNDPHLLSKAALAASFLMRHRISDPADEDYGLLLAYENNAINVTAIFEALDGLLVLAEIGGNRAYSDAAVSAAQWALRKAYKPGTGLFREEYLPDERRFSPAHTFPDGYVKDGAPMIDDGVLVKVWKLTGERAYLDTAVEVAEKLLADEDPPGNWSKYPPNNWRTRVCHPRTAYWWGRPLWMVGQASGQERFVAAAHRAAQWYRQAMRLDGGFFRSTSPEFNTHSFDHATSGVACASILWLELVREFGEMEWQEPLRRALGYCYSVQFSEVGDTNLKGAVLEKVLHPQGSDAPPWYLRDLGTFFYMQALGRVLTEWPQVLELAPGLAAAQGA